MTDVRADLEAFLQSEFEIPDEGPIETPGDERRAIGMLRALNGARRELAAVVQHAEEQIAPIVAWRDDRCAGLSRRVAELERALEGYARGQLEGRTKNKQLAYPYGTLALRAASAGPLIVDENAYTPWASADAKRKELLVTTVVKPKLRELGQIAELGPQLDDFTDDDGVVWKRWAARFGDELIPGVEIRRRRDDTFSVKPV